jgi:RND family efflux transporter MFP subunit
MLPMSGDARAAAEGRSVRRNRGRGASLIAPVLALGLFAFCGCNRAPEPGRRAAELPAATVELATVESKARVAMEEVPGSVRAKTHASLEAKISGRIERMLVLPGQAVKAGELLAELDSREVKAKLDQAAAVREQTEQELKRAQGLLASTAISQQEFDLAQSRARVSSATVAEMQTMLDHAKIVAPFTGIITRKLAEVGDLAAPGKLLMELEDPEALRLEADVPEGLIDRVHMGEKFLVKIASLTNAVESVASEITPVSDPGSRTFLAKFDLPAGAGLRVGQFGRVLVPVGQGAAARVPASAVIQRGQLELVFVAVDGRAQLRLVKTGKRVGTEVEVVSGLSPGEKVVSSGAGTLTETQPLVAK